MLTLTDVLAYHDVTVHDADIARRMAMRDMTYAHAYSESLDDEARSRGIIRACLGCGSVVAVTDGTPEYDRARTRDAIDWDAPESDCCPDADAVMF
jgi:hypothetical protein